ncbi:esterase [Photorhabdus luminescens subsp. luminescens]|uniref:Lipase (Class 3) n=1 Tax=Photorhabdus luminescens TaxID=29488 RepID=A0A1G5QZ66_PHOLU|nr:lipase family protein [Photorhabdus luminescens]KMW73074.1 esterase [Photorhabdus luminescens subsp. luminescens]SCZ66860.1 Lipase (class 3) [Photorhabdus luminescens]
MTISLEEQKLNLALGLIINSGEISDKPDKINTIKFDINKSLKNSKTTADKFSIIWGPAVFRIDEKHHDKKYDHVVMIVKNIDNPSDYRLVIRGTWSTINEFDEDLLVATTVDWSNWDTNIPKEFKDAKISYGTDLALKSLINGKPLNKDNTSLSLIDEIDKITTEEGKDKILNITVTGHSLGGLLASTIGLYLKRRYLNKGNDNIHIQVCTFAAPTAGNKIFASYSESVFSGTLMHNYYKSNFLRIHNNHDIVPLAWAIKDLKKIKAIYPHIAIKILVDAVILSVWDKNYTQIFPDYFFTTKIPDSIHGLFNKIGYQHIDAYPRGYGMSFIRIDNSPEIPTDYDIVVVNDSLSESIIALLKFLTKNTIDIT